MSVEKFSARLRALSELPHADFPSLPRAVISRFASRNSVSPDAFRPGSLTRRSFAFWSPWFTLYTNHPAQPAQIRNTPPNTASRILRTGADDFFGGLRILDR